MFLWAVLAGSLKNVVRILLHQIALCRLACKYPTYQLGCAAVPTEHYWPQGYLRHPMHLQNECNQSCKQQDGCERCLCACAGA